jgi:hypothetical protein
MQYLYPSIDIIDQSKQSLSLSNIRYPRNFPGLNVTEVCFLC